MNFVLVFWFSRRIEFMLLLQTGDSYNRAGDRIPHNLIFFCKDRRFLAFFFNWSPTGCELTIFCHLSYESRTRLAMLVTSCTPFLFCTTSSLSKQFDKLNRYMITCLNIFLLCANIGLKCLRVRRVGSGGGWLTQQRLFSCNLPYLILK